MHRKLGRPRIIFGLDELRDIIADGINGIAVQSITEENGGHDELKSKISTDVAEG